MSSIFDVLIESQGLIIFWRIRTVPNSLHTLLHALGAFRLTYCIVRTLDKFAKVKLAFKNLAAFIR